MNSESENDLSQIERLRSLTFTSHAQLWTGMKELGFGLDQLCVSHRETALSLLGLIINKTLKIPSVDASMVARAVTAPFRNTSALVCPFVSIHSIVTPAPMNEPTEAN